MSEVTIDLSGATGSGSSIKIYQTSNYAYPWLGACIMHGSFTTGPTSPDDQRVEIVELQMPGIRIRVRATEVRGPLLALCTANKAHDTTAQAVAESAMPAARHRSFAARHQAFDELLTAIMGLAGSHLKLGHFEMIVRHSIDAGVREGQQLIREELRRLLGL